MLIRLLFVPIVCALALVLTTGVAGCASPQTTSAEAASQSDPFENTVRGIGLDEAQERAASDGRVLIVFSTADWCGPCRRMKANTWTDHRIRQWMHRNALVYYLDVDDDGPLSDELNIQSIPTMIAYRGENEIDRIVGNHEVDSFLIWLNGLGEQRAVR